MSNLVLQEFAISKNIQLGDEKGLRFPSVWDWSLQFTAKDRTLFHNPSYVGKSTPCIQNGSVKPFKRTKVNDQNTLTEKQLLALNQKHLFGTDTSARAGFPGVIPSLTEVAVPGLFFLVCEALQALGSSEHGRPRS